MVLRRRGSFSFLVYPPLLVAFASALAVFLVQSKGSHFQDWASQQLEISQLSPLPEMGEWSSAPMGEFYKEMLLPFLEKTFLAWFSFAFALIFFINAAIENMVRGRAVPTWKRFLSWRSHDFVLVVLVLGLALTASPLLFPSLPRDLMAWGLHLCLLSLFPILIQGCAVASFVIPRSSLFVFVVLLALLLIEPLPVLLLAGFGDLWFDFRAKLKARSQL